MRLWLALLCLTLTGCASWSRETMAEETAYQVLGAVDGYETAHLGWCSEANGTWLYAIAGPHPSQRTAIAYSVARDAGHAVVTGILEAHDVNPWWKRLWQGAGIQAEGHMLVVNWHNGCSR